ncbi:cold shock domain-containing protein [Streptomyces sp. NBC_01571]|uniref:cold-shock protein n=1 Tax=Streptomyces sp. NBC_01571 TaxID=2975883 RepID=UPI00224C8B83|nr:cold shock domain-containing protein [Streptomyces sp. NBC_01571]MCX4581354.1 cold shock domain-containing protein [Streptomyces sp. NBC_01571]
MTVGRVVRFDGVRGYGFVAPVEGGEDVFLHVNDILVPEAAISPGVMVEFVTAEGERGPKASQVRLAMSTASRSDEEALCDVLSAEELSRELTELLLLAEPSLTGQQILDVRRRLLVCAEQHGWTEG